MHIRRGFNTLALAGLAALTGVATAGPLNRRHVPADCAMLFHVDIEALHDSSVGKLLEEHHEEIKVDLGEFEEHTGIDPFEDLLDVTAYVLSGGRLEKGGDGLVLLATMSEDLDGLIDMLEEHGEEVDYRVRERDGRTIHSFESDGDRVYAMVEEERGGRHRLVVSHDSDALHLALDVIDGDAESLRESSSLLSGFRPQDGAIVYAAVASVDSLPIKDEEIRSRFLAKAEGAYFQFGEDDDEVFATLQVSTHKEEDAILLAQIGQGLVAAGAMVNSADDVDADVRLSRARLLNGVRFQAEGSRIRLNLRFDADELFDMIETVNDF